MIEMYLKYDNMHTYGTFNALICINNHVNSCINCMLSGSIVRDNIISLISKIDVVFNLCMGVSNKHTFEGSRR